VALLAGGLVLLCGLFVLCAAGAGWWALRGGLFGQGPSALAGKGGGPDRWTVLFRSDDPSLWDTDTRRGNDLAVPLRQAPAAFRYLRLRRLDTSEALILPLSPAQLGTIPTPIPERGFWWNGANKLEYGGRHLGIVQGPRLPWLSHEGTIAIELDGWDAFAGSGFGHKHHGQVLVQYYAWRGQEVPRTVFEVAVSDGPLTDDERRSLLPDR
jgi:hypothetical protein